MDTQSYSHACTLVAKWVNKGRMAVEVASVMVGVLAEWYWQVCWWTVAVECVLVGRVNPWQWQVSWYKNCKSGSKCSFRWPGAAPGRIENYCLQDRISTTFSNAIEIDPRETPSCSRLQPSTDYNDVRDGISNWLAGLPTLNRAIMLKRHWHRANGCHKSACLSQ